MAVFLRVGRGGADRVVRPCGVGRRGRRPLQREALSLRTSDRVTGVAIRFSVAALVIQGGQSRPPLQRDGFPRQSVPQGHLLRGAHWLGMTGNGTSGTPSPTHCVIARSTPRALASRREATRQSALPGTKKRIPAPVTRADRVVRPCEAGRRGRRPLQREALSLRTSDRVTGVAIRFSVAALVIQGGQSRPPLQRDGFPRQSVPQGHLLRGAHWLGMTGNGTSYPKGICSAALHCRTPSPTGRSLHRYFSKKQDLPGQVLFCFAITRSRRAAERSDGRA